MSSPTALPKRSTGRPTLERYTLLTLLCLALTGATSAVAQSASSPDAVALPQASWFGGLPDDVLVTGRGYDAFIDLENPGFPSQGDNEYAVHIEVGPNGEPRGWWRAFFFISAFGGAFMFDVDIFYPMECVEIDHRTREAWIIGPVGYRTDTGGPTSERVLFYVKDGGGFRTDSHGLRSSLDDEVTCDQRPEPSFVVPVQQGDYRIARRR